MVKTNKLTFFDGEFHSVINNPTLDLYKEFSYQAKKSEQFMMFSSVRERYVCSFERRYRETLDVFQNNLWRTFCEIPDYEQFCRTAKKVLKNTISLQRKQVVQRVIMLNLKARPQGWKELFTKPSHHLIKLIISAKVWPMYKVGPDERNRLTVKMRDPAFRDIKLVFNTDEKLYDKYVDMLDKTQDVKPRKFDKFRRDKLPEHLDAHLQYVRCLPKSVRRGGTLSEMACPENQNNIHYDRNPPTTLLCPYDGEVEIELEEPDVDVLTRFVEENVWFDDQSESEESYDSGDDLIYYQPITVIEDGRITSVTTGLDADGNFHVVRLNMPQTFDWNPPTYAALEFSSDPWNNEMPIYEDIGNPTTDSVPSLISQDLTLSQSESDDEPFDVDDVNYVEGFNLPDGFLSSGESDLEQPENQGIFDSFRGVKNSWNKVVDTSEKVGSVAGKMDTMLDTLKNTVTKCFEGVKDVGNIFLKLTPFALSFYQLHLMNWDLTLAWPTVANMAMNLVSLFGDSIVTSVRGCVASICTLFQNIDKVSEMPKSQNTDSEEPKVKVPIKALKFIGKLVTATLTGGDKCVKEIVNAGKKVKGVWEAVHYGARLFEVIKDALISGLNWTYKKLTGRPLPMLETQFDEDYAKWCDQIQEQAKLENRQKLMTCIDTQAAIENLYLEAYPLLTRGLKLKGTSFTTPFNAMRNIINALYMEVRNKAIQKGESRPEPVSVLIYGKPGCGKSFFQTEIAKALVHLEKGIAKDKVNIDRDVYYKKTETGTDQYITGYIDQIIFCIDDLGAVNDSQSNPNLDYVHIMGMVGTLPYCFPSASMSEKGQIFFKSSYLLLTSNIAYHRPPSLFSHEAINRRFKYTIYLYLKPEFAGLDGRIDPIKARDSTELPWELYVFTNGENVPGYDSGVKPSENRRMDMTTFVRMLYDKRKANVALFGDLSNNNFSCFPKDYSGVKPGQVSLPEQKIKNQDALEKSQRMREKAEEDRKRTEARAANLAMAHKTTRTRTPLKKSQDSQIPKPVNEGNGSDGYETCNEFEQEQELKVKKLQKPYMTWTTKLMSLSPFVEKTLCMPFSADPQKQLMEFIRFSSKLENVYLPGITLSSNFPVKASHASFVKMFIDSKMTRVQRMQLDEKSRDDLNYMLQYSVPQYLFAALIAHIDRCPEDARRQCFDEGVFGPEPMYSRICSPIFDKEDGLWQNYLLDLEYQFELARMMYIKYEDVIWETGKKVVSYLYTGLILFINIMVGWMLFKWVTQPNKPANQISVYDAQPPTARNRPAPVIKMPAPQSSVDPDFENTIRSVAKNLYCLYLVKQKGGVPFYASQILGVKGKCFLFTRHDAESLKHMYEILLVRRGKIWARTTNTQDLQFIPATAPDGTYLDSGLVVLKGINDQKDIVSKFVTEEDIARLGTMYIALLKATPGLSESDLPDGEVRYGFAKPITYLHQTDEGEDVHVSRSVRYGIPTFKGDCVSPAIISNAAVQRKILGHHTAGLDGFGYANVITQETLQMMFKAVNQSCLVSFNPDEVVKEPNRVWIYPINESVSAFEEENDLMGNVLPVGTVDAPKGATVSKITPSLAQGELELNGEIVKPVRGKAVLFKPGRNMLGESLQKVIQDAPFLDEKKAQLVLDELFEKLSKDADSYSPKRFLDTYESFHGVEGDEYLKPMNRKTSNGWPEVNLAPKNTRGKEYYLGKEENRFVHQYLIDKMEENIAKVSNNERPVFVFQDCLKDELRPLEKTEKPRAFSIGNICYTGFTRKFMLPFCAFLMRNRIKNGIAVGIDAHSEWNLLNEHLRVKGPHCFDGDIGKFDGSISHNLLMMICEKILEFIKKVHNVTVDEEKCIRAIFASIANSVHVCNGKVYVWGHSEPSGNPLTAYINSIITIVYLGIAWQLVFEGTEYEHPSYFFEHCTFVTYGDDHVVNVSPSAAKYYNQQTVAKALATIGIEYTTAEKDGAFYETKSLEECIFLKRHCGGYADYGRLNRQLIWDMVMWSKKGKNDVETFLQTLTGACTEIAFHGRFAYDEFVDAMKKVLRSKRIDYDFKSFSYYLFQRGHCVYTGAEL